MRSMKLLSTTGALGVTPMYVEAFEQGLLRDPEMIGADAGSSDLGGFGLGSNEMYIPRAWEKHDLQLMLVAAAERRIPMIVGSAGHMGTDKGVDHLCEIIEEIAAEQHLPPFKLGRVYSEMDLDYLRMRAKRGEIHPLDGADEDALAAVDASSHVVAMAGVEPIIKALDGGADVVIAGRACDDAIFAAPAIRAGYPRGLAFHLGKVLECASVAATPYRARASLLGTISDEDILFEPMSTFQRCTIESVCAHALYEREDPLRQLGPGGELDMTKAVFEQHSEREVRTFGAQFHEDPSYKVKLEGAGFVGHRNLSMVGIRDPNAIHHFEDIVEFVKAKIDLNYGSKWTEGEDFHYFLHAYGRNAIMKEWEPVKETQSHELGVLCEAVAKDRQLAYEIARMLGKYINQSEFPGQKAGGIGAILADEVMTGADLYRWTMHHLLPISDPMEVFRIELTTVAQ